MFVYDKIYHCIYLILLFYDCLVWSNASYIVLLSLFESSTFLGLPHDLDAYQIKNNLQPLTIKHEKKYWSKYFLKKIVLEVSRRDILFISRNLHFL